MVENIDETAFEIEVCPRCGNTDYIKDGSYKTKIGRIQRVRCRICDRLYILRPKIMKKKIYKTKIFNLIIHLSYFNLTPNKIRDILLKYLRIKISAWAIYKWIKEFGNPSYKKAHGFIIQQIEEDSEFKKRGKEWKKIKKE